MMIVIASLNIYVFTALGEAGDGERLARARVQQSEEQAEQLGHALW